MATSIASLWHLFFKGTEKRQDSCILVEPWKENPTCVKSYWPWTELIKFKLICLLFLCPSHDTDVVSKGLGRVPRVIDHTAHCFETPKGFLSCLSILIQPILKEAEVGELNPSPSLLDVAF